MIRRMQLSDDELDRVRDYLRRAAHLAGEGMGSNCGGPFGAVVVKGGQIVGEGFNRVLIDCDPSAHAEIVAIRHAGKALGTFELRGCEIFASGQPCPMCLAAIYWSRIDRVYFANTIEQAAEIGFDDCNFYGQLALPLEQRSVPQIHVPVEEAAAVFGAWAKKIDKTKY
jgi:tRNA(Arg) A34 adenosine deaminase TadA